MRKSAIDRKRILLYEFTASAFVAEAEIFHLHHTDHRVVIVGLQKVDLIRSDTRHAPEFIDKLQAAIKDAAAIATDMDDAAVRYHLNGAAYDVARRVDLWRAAHALAAKSDHVLIDRIAPFSEAALVSELPAGSSSLCE